MRNPQKACVYNLCIASGKVLSFCAQIVNNSGFIRSAKMSTLTYAHILHTQTRLLMTSIFSELTSMIAHLSTLSTQPIITIYLNKRVEELA